MLVTNRALAASRWHASFSGESLECFLFRRVLGVHCEPWGRNVPALNMQEQRRAHISRNNSSSSLRAQTLLHTHSSDPLPEVPKRLGIVSLHLHSLPDISIHAEALPSAIRFFATSVFSAPSIVYHAVPHFTGLNTARPPILIARCKPIVRALQSWATQSLGANLKTHVPIEFGVTAFAKDPAIPQIWLADNHLGRIAEFENAHF